MLNHYNKRSEVAAITTLLARQWAMLQDNGTNLAIMTLVKQQQKQPRQEQRRTPRTQAETNLPQRGFQVQPLAQNQYISNSSGIVSCIRTNSSSPKNTFMSWHLGCVCVTTATISRTRAGKGANTYFKHTSSKRLSCICASIYHSLRIYPHPMVWPLPRPWSQTMVSDPL